MVESTDRLLNESAKKLALLGERLRASPHQSFLSEPIAIIGMGCRFPGAENLEAFWQLLVSGRDAITEVPPNRWDVDDYYDASPQTPGKSYSRWGGFLDRVDEFDAGMFGISPREARHMDPRQRILLETTWVALNQAGQVSDRLSGTNTGVFIGHMVGDYYALETTDVRGIDSHVSTGNLDSILANRLSYVLNLQGPSLAVDTACSSSLVAVYLACQSLRQDECALAIAGGVNLMLTPEMHVMGAQSLLLSPEGSCKTFDRAADGFVRGEGCGLLVLKRLADALKANDQVLAVIRGIAVNQDGRTNGISAPNGLSQQRVIRRALDNALLDPARVTFVETHGTGTVVGDTIEVEALAEVYGRPSSDGPCYLGAVKTNIGHLEGAAGAAGVIKMVLCLQHGQIPPNLNFAELNPHIAMAPTRFQLPLKMQPWSVAPGPRYGAVSSFGLGGTNGHVILEEAPHIAERTNDQERPVHEVSFQRQRYWLPRSTELSRNGTHSRWPLIDNIVQSPLVKETILTTVVNVSRFPFLTDHRVFGETVTPGAFYLSMLLNGVEALGWEACRMEDVVYVAPLALPPHEERTIQAVLSPADAEEFDQGAGFQIISLPGRGSPEAMTMHATGKISGTVERELRPLEVADIQARCTDPTDPEAMASSVGVDLGPSFRWAEQAWLGNGECLARLRRTMAIANAEGYWLHPGLLDACIQIAGAIPSKTGAPEPMLPFGFRSLNAYRVADGDEWWCYARQVAANEWDIQLSDTGGQTILRIDGFEMRPASRDAFLVQQIDEWLYSLEWQPQPLADKRTLPDGPEGWLIISDGTDVGEEVAALLAEQGQQCVLVPGQDSLQSVDEFGRLLNMMLPSGSSRWHGIVFLSGAKRLEGASDLPVLAEALCTRVLHIMQALSQHGRSPRLWLVTQGAQAAGNAEPIDVPQTSLWGMARTLRLEHPETHCVTIDLPLRPSAEDIDALLAELAQTGDESQVAIRSGQRSVARLVRTRECGKHSPDGPVRLELGEYGSIDQLRFVPLTRRQPGMGEVEIEVKASALNFRDLLIALGLLKDYYAGAFGIERARDVPLGFDCAGTIVAVGAGVIDLKVGDSVMTPAAGSAASFLTASQTLVTPIPAGFSFEAASAIPTAFFTACHALLSVAQLKPGERVLIHAAAGGVGLAAVQLARMVGAEVLATASPGKWEFLKAQGIRQVLNSRTFEFADEIMRLTGGEGVDVVLNSLSSEAIAKSLHVLKQGGRFVEIGKIGIWTPEQVSEQRPDVSYSVFDFDEAIGRDRNLLRSTLGQVRQWFEEGRLHPVPVTMFPAEDVTEAYRFLQQSRHIGKVVLSFTSQACPSIRAEGSYLITGGLGALGLYVAKELVDQGARHLVLAGRGGPAPKAQEAIHTMRAEGASVQVVTADVARADDVTRLIGICQAEAQLRGIVHAAGVLDDGVMEKQNAERLAKVMAPKARGAWNLHTQTPGLPLDFFVCFSSMASLLGSPGQSNYAAANAFLDGLAHSRRAQGLPGLSINWGPWAGAGMAAGLRSRLQDDGEGMIDPKRGVRILAHALARGLTQVGAMRVDWSRYLAKHPQSQLAGFLSGVRPKRKPRPQDRPDAGASERTAPVPMLIQRLRGTPIDQRRAVVEEFLQSQVAQVLGHQAAAVPRTQGFAQLGLDSLAAIELCTRLQRALDCTLPSTLAFDHPTVEALAGYLIDQAITVDALESAVSPDAAPTAADGLAGLSRSEIAALLEQELSTLEEGNK
jgi:myxalamid-type polyketide synthase MxaB